MRKKALKAETEAFREQLKLLDAFEAAFLSNRPRLLAYAIRNLS